MLFALASCGKNSKAYKELKSDYDSLNLTYQSHVNELDSVVSIILSNFQDINQMEGMIDLNTLKGDVQTSQQNQVEDNMKMIKERLEQNRNEIEKLNQRLKASGNNAASLKRTVSTLEKQLEGKTQEIIKLAEELKRKDIQISQLDSIVTGLTLDMEASSKTISEQNETIASQDTEINTVYYCVGTRADLEDMKILQNGKLATENYESDYYSAVDKRKFTSLPLYSKKATLLTNHAESSYKLVQGVDKQLTIEITDPDLFWKHSRRLVIRVN